MKKITKLFTGLLFFGFLFVLSASVVSANPPMGYPFKFFVTGMGPVLVGEFFELDGVQFAGFYGNLYVRLVDRWYFVEEGAYAIENSPYPLTVHIFEDYHCNLLTQVCDPNSGSGGGH